MKEIFNGNIDSDKKLLILSGIHGNEYNPCILLQYIKNDKILIEFLQKKFNTITFFYNINEIGIINNTRENIHIDLNRIYSYDFSIIEDIKNLINESTHIVDLHSSPHCSNFILINETNTANSYVEFAINNNINYLLYNQYNQYTIKHQSQLLDKISITFEMNGIDKITINDVIGAKIEIDKILYNIHNININFSQSKYLHLLPIEAKTNGMYYLHNNKLMCNDLYGITTVENIENNFIATYPIKGYYKKGEIVLLLQPQNNII